MKTRLSRIFPFKSTSWYVTLFLFALVIYFTFSYAVPKPLSWDNIGYYTYLNELFTDGDLQIADLSYYEGIMAQYHNTTTLYQFIPVETEIGGVITKYSAGWSVVNAPFLCLGHLCAGWLGYAQDGFSAPYQIATIISSLFYTLLGLIFMRRILLYFFSEKTTIILLVSLVLGTNYFHIHIESTATIHIYLFALYATLIWLTLKFHAEKKIKTALLIGLNLGLLILIRPTEILAIMIPLLYGVQSFSDLKLRFFAFFKERPYLLATLVLILVNVVQLWYWKYATGKFLYYSYANEGEGMDFNQPHIRELLFSFRKGWFLYTPFMLLLVLGFVRLYKQKRELFWALFAFTILNLYLLSCWTTWWYADSFSQRSLSHTYPIYVLAIGFLFSKLNRIQSALLGIFVTACIVLNLFQTFQARYEILHLSRVTEAYYFSIFGQTTDPTPEQKELLLIDRDLASFDNVAEYKLIQTIYPEFDLPLILNDSLPQTPLIQFPYESLTDKDHLWVRAHATIEPLFPDSVYQNTPFAAHLCVCMLHHKRTYAWRNTPLESLTQAGAQLQKDYLTPYFRSADDELAVRVWLQYGPAIKVTSLSFDLYEKK